MGSASAATRAGPPSFGIGIACCNEAQNVGELLQALATSFGAGSTPQRIVVVSDASTDGTDEIVRRFAESSSVPVLLESRSERGGKASAINRIIELSGEVELIVLISADVLPVPGWLPSLLTPFEQDDVGVAGCRVEPTGSDRFLAVRVSRLLWRLHHRIALRRPKSTEVTVFRNRLQRIDETSLVDEAEIEVALRDAGFRVVYVPEAIVRSASPTAVTDYLRQRVRVTLGHLALAERRGYRVATLSPAARVRALVDEVRQGGVDASTVMAAAVLESAVLVAAHAARWWSGAPTGRWPRIDSAKRPVAPR
ncbi:MAG: glycosyltransferase [Deltaproteobacteria bacterium]|jgi:cellulose synthase/poly-beta-1,6-N-acetylglucosamine synthase-like glycosyltransferase|nr:glycosyltransferase [Deltaproteobacteria bacterium]MBW2531632.1 glycosyltransferase [Deltaproteobacteria bacterium]